MPTPTIELTDVKSHLRLDDDYQDEDTLLIGYIDAALEVCQKHIGKRFDSGLELTAAIKVGCLMYITFLYEQRSMVSDVESTEVPLTVSALWSVYRDVGIY